VKQLLTHLAERAATAAGEAAGRYLAQRPTGRLDATWTARNSTSSPAYQAAAKTRANQDWRASLSGATQAILDGLDTMLARSRWLVRNDGYAASLQGGFRRRVVGGGITARAAARHPETAEMLRGYNREHDRLWTSWALDPRLCDIERTRCLYEQQAVWMDELFAAGGVLIRLVYLPHPTGIGLAIQTLEYEQLDTELTSYQGRAVYRGIETDAYGAPVAYHVHAASHPLEEKPSATVRIEADGVFHLFRKGRVRQRLGAPWMAPVIPEVRNLAMFQLYTVSKARTEAAYHGFVKDRGNGPGSTYDAIRQSIGAAPKTGENDAAGEMQVRVENGLFPVLTGDRDVVFPPSATPNTVYPQFVAESLKKIAAGTGLDLPVVARWFADGNFNTQRAAALERDAEVETIQDLIFINGGLRWIRELFTEIAVREGKLKATGWRESPRWRSAYLQTNWQGPPKRSVDPLKDQAAWDLQYRSLRASPADYFNETGKDAGEVLAEWQEFVTLADEAGLGPVVRQYFKIAAPNTPKAGMQPDGTGDQANPADATPGGGAGDDDDDLSRAVAERLNLQGLLDEPGGNGRH